MKAKSTPEEMVDVEVEEPLISGPSSGSRLSAKPIISPAKVKATYSVAKTPIAPPASVQLQQVSSERPLIALDWHTTLSFESVEGYGVSERSAQILREAQDKGFDLCTLSFASNPETLFETEFHRPFVSIDIVNSKHLNDEQRRPSVSGLVTRKAEQRSLMGTSIFVDDQWSMVNPVCRIKQHVSGRGEHIWNCIL